jgi:hypothetical protein
MNAGRGPASQGAAMEKRRLHVPIGLPIAGVILLIVGNVLGPIIQNNFSERTLSRNTILNGIPFILIFVSIVLFFMSAIWLIASALNKNVSMRIYKPVETIIIAGIVLGIIGMFQPWLLVLYRLGFRLLLASTIAFMVWSHIIPKGKRPLGEMSTASISDRDVAAGD